jgi:hypothetical protein
MFSIRSRAFYMLGLTFLFRGGMTGQYWLGLIFAPLGVGLIGVFVERVS